MPSFFRVQVILLILVYIDQLQNQHQAWYSTVSRDSTMRLLMFIYGLFDSMIWCNATEMAFLPFIYKISLLEKKIFSNNF